MKRILKTIINAFRSFIPEQVMLQYHHLWAILATFRYRAPARDMRIIGITGTKGKTSTGYFIHTALSATNEKVGLISTAVIRIGEVENINRRHMTMPGRAVIQNLLRQMKDAGCTTVIVEVTSEGIKYYRHIGIFFDILIFTNLTPEHLSSHDNDFNKYKKTKLSIFENLYKQPKKKYEKHILVNADDQHGKDFLECIADRHTTFGIEGGDVRATNIRIQNGKTHFIYENEEMVVPLGVFNVYNALPALVLAHKKGAVSLQVLSKALKSIDNIPGRMDCIVEKPVTVIVDYAHEPNSIKSALEAVREYVGEKKKVIVVIGGVGGGRDMESRRGIGREAGQHADVVVVTDVDPYDESPEAIIKDVYREVEKVGKVVDINLFVVIDRRKAIHTALKLADVGDVVLITGKGSEMTYMKKEGATPWDERAIVREEVKKVLG